MEDSKVEILQAIEDFRAHSHLPIPDRHLLVLLEKLAHDGEKAVKIKILQSLAYDDMGARQARILDAYKETFEWVFEDQKLRFCDWLKSDSTGDAYWIIGKPGSGKSTLMNFLCHHERTKNSLHVWANQGKQLIIASHFFWAIGSEKQRSQEGLLRSLLHGILSQCQALIPLVCPPDIQRNLETGNRDPWSLRLLRQTFRRVLNLDKIPSSAGIASSIRICLFVDGLDEHAGQEAELIELFQSSRGSNYIKLCLASKPWPNFIDAYAADGKRMLQLHELTKHDIRRYVREQLSNHPQVSDFKDRDYTMFSSLIDEIVSKAEGVFLWVYLVVRSLLEGFRNEDDISDLKRRLKDLPPDLNKYYQHVLDGIGTFYRKDTAQLLQIFICARAPLPLIGLHFAMGSTDAPLQMKTKSNPLAGQRDRTKGYESDYMHVAKIS